MNRTDYLKLKKKIKRIELFILAALYVFFFVVVLDNKKGDPNLWIYESLLLFGTVIPVFFLHYIWPRYFEEGKIDWGVGLTLATFVLEWIVLSFGFYWAEENPSHGLDYYYGPAFGFSFVSLLVLSGYVGLRYTLIRFLLNSKKSIGHRVMKEIGAAAAIGIAVFIIVVQIVPAIGTFSAMAIPYAYCLYALHTYWVLPYAEKNKLNKTTLGALSLLVGLVCLVVFSSGMELLLQVARGRYASFDGLQIVGGLFISGAIIPLTYVLYFGQRKQRKEVFGLQKELGRTSADLKLLQSQVNPHFLFNMMNTLYGVALQENAERTATGIQKLGDMMRFMIHENQQERILLSRELAYLKEYIDLQKLRIADLPSIEISSIIPDQVLDRYYIAPMLLIPFVENAFKHGISFAQQSWIRVQLELDGEILKLSVYNSIHSRGLEGDLESAQSGIGLENVKQRLHLLYPHTHQLNIEQTQREFFIFLTLGLDHEE